jgi:hypothetical protein
MLNTHLNVRAKPGNPPKINAVSEIGELRIEEYFHFIFRG